MNKLKTFLIKRKIVVIIFIVLIGIAVVAATFAFFISQVSSPSRTSLKAETSQEEELIFSPGGDLSIHATIENFSTTTGSLNDTTSPTVTLLPDNETGSATSSYSIYYQVEKNNYVYTQKDSTPEILLKITNQDGNLINNITKLDYVTVMDKNGVEHSGFDMTTQKGVLELVKNQPIDTTNTEIGTTHTWDFELIFLNLDSDQSGNTEKLMESKIIFSAAEYKFTPNCDTKSLASCITDNYAQYYGLYHHTNTLTNGALDDNYRFAGIDEIVSHNYLCFGSDEEECPSDNLYRIIGVYDGLVKIVKNTTNLSLPWDTEVSKIHNNSSLEQYLNNDFYNSFPTKYQNYVSSYDWKYGSFPKNPHDNANSSYEISRIENTYKTVNNKIMLISLTDLAYSTDPENWSRYYSDEAEWIFSGLDEWVISIYDLNNVQRMFSFQSTGLLTYHDFSQEQSVRPSFYLTESVMYKSGNGTIDNPFRL